MDMRAAENKHGHTVVMPRPAGLTGAYTDTSVSSQALLASDIAYLLQTCLTVALQMKPVPAFSLSLFDKNGVLLQPAGLLFL